MKILTLFLNSTIFTLAHSKEQLSRMINLDRFTQTSTKLQLDHQSSSPWSKDQNIMVPKTMRIRWEFHWHKMCTQCLLLIIPDPQCTKDSVSFHKISQLVLNTKKWSCSWKIFRRKLMSINNCSKKTLSLILSTEMYWLRSPIDYKNKSKSSLKNFRI